MSKSLSVVAIFMVEAPPLQHAEGCKQACGPLCPGEMLCQATISLAVSGQFKHLHPMRLLSGWVGQMTHSLILHEDTFSKNLLNRENCEYGIISKNK